MCAFCKIFLQQTTTIRHTKMAEATVYSFEAKIASRGYYVYKNTTWVNANEGNELQVETEAKIQS